MRYKGVNLPLLEIKKRIKEYLSSNYQNYKLEEEVLENGYQFKISLPNQDKAIINFYTTKRGFTIDPDAGKNQKLSNEIAKFIVSTLEENQKEVKLITQVLNDILKDLFLEFINVLDIFGAQIVKDQEKDDFRYLKLRNNFNQEIILHYYPSSKKLLIQGYATKFLRNVLVWFIDKITLGKRNDENKIVFNSDKDLQKFEIEFPDKIIEEKLKELIGEHYKDKRFINDSERKWLKVSYYLLEFEKDLSDYYASLSSSIKVLEGLLRRIVLKTCGYIGFYKNRAFKIFYYDEESNNYLIKRRWKNKFKSEEQVKFVEKLYNLYKKLLNYTYNNGMLVSITEISSHKQAKEIFNSVLEVLREVKKSYPEGL